MENTENQTQEENSFSNRIDLSQLKTAVLVNRNHKNYPIKADFKGISLSTSINEHIEVNLNPKSEGVYLN